MSHRHRELVDLLVRIANMESSNFERIDPVNPVAPYIGGKRLLAKTITKRIAAIPHTTYAEPFVGMGGVFLRRGMRAKCEVINDINQDISNLFRILQRHYPQFLDTIKFQITSRSEFKRLQSCQPETLTDLERAARYLYMQRTTFGGNPKWNSFGVTTTELARFNLTNLEPMLEALHERLSGVVIECLPYAAFIERYDRPYTLFYLDPPYWGCVNDYGKNIFSHDDFAKLSNQLKAIKGKFILSINDKPEIRELFDWAEIEVVETKYSVGNARGNKVGELLIGTNCHE